MLFTVSEDVKLTTPQSLAVGDDRRETSCKVTLELNDMEVCCLIDSGATCNLMGSRAAARINFQVEKTTKHLYTYGTSKPLNFIGQAKGNVFVPSTGKRAATLFYVYDGHAPTLLSKSMSELLGLLRIGPVCSGLARCWAVNSLIATVSAWQEGYPECFSGVRKLKDF